MVTTVKKLSETVGLPVNKLLEKLTEAGIFDKGKEDTVTEKEKLQLVSHLKKNKQGASVTTRRSTSQLKIKTPGKAPSTISVETRKKTTSTKTKATAVWTKPVADDSDKAKVSNKKTVKKTVTRKTLIKKDEAKEALTAEATGPAKPPRAKTPTKSTKKATSPQKKLLSNETTTSTEAASVAPVSRASEARTSSAKASTTQVVETPPPEPDTTLQEQQREQLSIASDKSGKRKTKRKTKHIVNVVQPKRHAFEKPTEQIKREVMIPEHIAVVDLAQRLAIKSGALVKQMMEMGMMTTINQLLDQDTAILIVEELGHRALPEKIEDVETNLAELADDDNLEKTSRPPVVVVMGHVDHGKTSLLDYIRRTKVADGEAGGITQHIGAYHVETDKGMITFLDTPGHAAFTAMRARGANVTDIAILVVAADDGVMPQTIEAIEHAKAAQTPVLVVFTKIDKEGTDIEKIKGDLAKHKIVPEEWGGDTIFVEVSSKTGQGIDDLLDAVLLQAEVMELKAATEGVAKGTVIESYLDKGRGAVATILVQQGKLKKGDILLAGKEFGRVRAMLDENAKPVATAGPSIPVNVLGLSSTPSAGDEVLVVATERRAREVADLRREKHSNKQQLNRQSASVDNFMENIATELKSIYLLIKSDTQGTAEAVRDALSKIVTDEVEVNILSSNVGGINVSDVNLAAASNALIIGFNVRADSQARKAAEEHEVSIRYYSIIYQLIEDIKQMVSNLLTPDIKEEITGIAEVKDVFRSSRFGTVAGCQVVEGTIKRGNSIRVLRDSIVIFEGELESLRRFKDDVSEVKAGVECGIAVKDYNDVKLSDQIEVFQRTETRRVL